MEPNTTPMPPQLAMYFCVNKSLGMSKGKIASQVGHAAHIITDTILRNKDTRPVLFTKYEEWYRTGAKMITLALTTDEMAEVLKRNDIIYVKDAGKTQVEPGSLTVVCVSPTLEKLKYKLL